MTKPTESFEGLRTIDKPEWPNQSLMIVKTIQSLITVVNDNLGKLDVLSIGSTKHKVLIRQALEEINLFECTTLNKLQKEYE